MSNSTISAGVSSAAAPAPEQVGEDSNFENISRVITLACMLLICLSFLTAATKHRLWHANSPIDKLHKFVLDQILDQLMDLASIYLLTSKGIYLVWGVILMIANGAITCIAVTHTLSDSRSSFMNLFFIGLLSYNLIVPLRDIEDADPFSHFVINLWMIWGLIILKTVDKFFSFWVAKRAYGSADRTNIISDYMRFECTLSTGTLDPVSMRGYKYIVSGEEKVSFQTKITDDRQVDIDIANSLSDKVVTVERVWDCRDQLLGRKMDSDGKFKDICLSFALMKLLRRRFLDYPAEELNDVSKSMTLVLQGLLNLESEDKHRAFRVIMTELGFLQDLFFSQYPIIFGCGFPIYNYLLSLLLLGATGCLANTAYSDTHDLGGNDIDLYITFVLVAMIIIMEITETATYLLSDWNKVTLLINYVKFPWLQKSCFINTALRFLCKIKIMQPVRDKIGQFSLLEQFGKFSIRAKLCNSRATFGNGVMKFCHASVKLPDEAKRMILDQLRLLSRGTLSNGESSLRRNGMEELGWTCKLQASTQTILLWHIATWYCEKMGQSQRSLPSSGKKEVATALSNYCAYLVVFVPDLLPDQGNKAKRILDKLASEIDKVGARDELHMLDIMMGLLESNTILGMGAELGKRLVESISDENKRWDVLAEFWAEYVLYLAPSDNVQAHHESLGSGGEFITHLWVLLYHAGVLDRASRDTLASNTYP
ncbi:uncharacterized protein LOC122005562 [Zingiber officinale]|nr:uncharacterized protein LOC122005562 [Zingiber officinale]